MWRSFQYFSNTSVHISSISTILHWQRWLKPTLQLDKYLLLKISQDWCNMTESKSLHLKSKHPSCPILPSTVSLQKKLSRLSASVVNATLCLSDRYKCLALTRGFSGVFFFALRNNTAFMCQIASHGENYEDLWRERDSVWVLLDSFVGLERGYKISEISESRFFFCSLNTGPNSVRQ